MNLDQLYATTWLLFPILLTIGIGLIPLVRNYNDHALAETAVNKKKRWFWGHIISGAAFGVGILATFCIGAYLSTTTAFGWALAGVPLAAIGGSLLAAGLGADGIGPVALQNVNQPAQLFFDGSHKLVPGVFIAGSVLFGLGQILLVSGINHTTLLTAPLQIIVLLAAIGMSLASAIPSGWGLYIVALLTWLIYLPLAASVSF